MKITKVTIPFIVDIHFYPGATPWYMAHEMRIKIEVAGEPAINITIPAGFEHDFASIPDGVPKWVADKQDARYAAIVHDYLYHHGIRSKEFADLVFLQIMKQTGVPKWRRQAMYLAVKMFGKGAYRV